jgi:hypothetical protein
MLELDNLRYSFERDGFTNHSLPYLLAYKTPLCGPCETNALSQGGSYSKEIYYGRWSVRHTNFTATLRLGGSYIRGGLIAKGGLICQ